MKWTTTRRIVVVTSLCVAIAGCGTLGASKKPPVLAVPSKSVKAGKNKATAAPRPVKVSPEMIAYARSLDPVLKSGIVLASALIKQSGATETAIMGKPCATAGGNISQSREAFQSVPAPKSITSLTHNTVSAYKLLLGATDECGIAADDNDSSSMSLSRRDMQSSENQLKYYERSLAAWAART